ncbi:hypothetical protein M409DRAFT_60154 [Zasmidium cellare ATCC 36951]|uniref:Dipeptidyl-peptidase V n=1 Tax=Zasmidium cellare ATCC 36951 TaxID=1080233 RepID=A0A6A6BZN9_ZASCE|nr:uncharacterized protein M409DRAFT_60154 [Zasmidium cellare ATCC 36951]KAF2160241.1 hypothetical protein M409DRAFT_60154 [Zasmidium cellare ATCC 36951]
MLEIASRDDMSSQTNRTQNTPIPSLCIERDISESKAFLEIQRRHEEVLRPGEGFASDLVQLDILPDGKSIVGVATMTTELKGSPTTRLVVIDTEVKDAGLQLFGKRKGSDIFPKWSPDGKMISFLSQVNQSNQLFLLDNKTGDVTQCTTDVKGSIERQSWSQDGSQVLLTVAGLGADKSGSGGGMPLDPDKKAEKSWLPQVARAAAPDEYRTLWIYGVESGNATQASPEGLNVWEAVWVSSTSVVGICSDLPGEEAWYISSVREIDLPTKTARTLYSSDVPIECLAASPSGNKIAFANGIASDRQILKGDLVLLDVKTGKIEKPETKKVDVGGSVVFPGEDCIVVTGSRVDVELIVQFDGKDNEMTEVWKSREHSTGGSYIGEVAARVVDGEAQVAFVENGWFSPPTLVYGTKTGVRELKIFVSLQLDEEIKALGRSRNLSWKAPDGLEIHGYFISPSSATGPVPTVLFVHGGPVWQWRPRYIASHGQQILERALLSNGIAIFKPNPRGSSGRGQAFIRHVYGDMGGKDTYDYLSGLESLVKQGLADPKRLGVWGGSYGGFMSSWLVTQAPDTFAAAVPVAPCTDWVSSKYTSNIGRFFDDFLGDSPHDPKGKYFTRSPIHHVDKVKTPTMTVVGGIDRYTPPSQGQEFHQALVEKGVPSVLLTYPEEGHGVRQMPALFDFVTRTMEWFKHFLL